MLPEKIGRKDEDAVHQASAGCRARPWPPHFQQHMVQSGPYFIWDRNAFVFIITGGLFQRQVVRLEPQGGEHVTIESCDQLSEELHTTVAALQGAYTEIVLEIPFCIGLELFVRGDSEFEIQVVSHGL